MRDPFPVSWLFVPADRPDRFERASTSGAGEMILDLEDAVAPGGKPAARETAAAWLSSGGTGWVRVNGTSTPWHAEDVKALSGCPGLRGLIVPKAEEPQVLAWVAQSIGDRRVVALIETARGVRSLDAICATDGIAGLAFGSIDLALDIDARESDEALLYARSALVIASRAAGLEAPIDGITVEFRDAEIVAAAAARSRALGFGGKLCIHPAQVLAVNAAFASTPAELDWARRVLAAASASGGGACVVDGRMVDRPVLPHAQRLLARAGERS